MRIKENYRVREIAGENLIVEQGKSQADMTKVISLNSTALLLWKELQGRDFSLKALPSLPSGSGTAQLQRSGCLRNARLRFQTRPPLPASPPPSPEWSGKQTL